MQVQFLGGEDPQEKEMATHSSILAWRSPWTEEPGGLPSKGSQNIRHNWSNLVQHRLGLWGPFWRWQLTAVTESQTQAHSGPWIKTELLEEIVQLGLIFTEVQVHQRLSLRSQGHEWFTFWGPVTSKELPSMTGSVEGVCGAENFLSFLVSPLRLPSFHPLF